MSCQLRPSDSLKDVVFTDELEFANALQQFLLSFANRTPLEVVASLAIDFGGQEAGIRILSSYDKFLGLLSDQAKRSCLDKLDVDGAQSDEVFQEARTIGTEIQRGLTQLFFETDKDLTQAIQRYGVF